MSFSTQTEHCHLFIYLLRPCAVSQVQQLFLGFLHTLGWAPDGHGVTARALGGEVDVDSTTVLHDGADEAAFGTNEGTVPFGRNRDLHLCAVGLREDSTSLLSQAAEMCLHPLCLPSNSHLARSFIELEEMPEQRAWRLATPDRSSHRLWFTSQEQTDTFVSTLPSPITTTSVSVSSSNIVKSLNRKRPVASLTSSFWMARILWRAASQFALLPVITIVSELLFFAGRSILVLLSSQICHKGKKK